MHVPVQLRRPLNAVALLSAAALAAGPLGPVAAGAAPNPARAEQRAVRAEERAARRAQRHQESEARHAARAEQREARRNARHGGGAAETAAPNTETSPSTTTDRGCSVSVAVSSPRVLSGETVTVTGTVTCPTSAAAAAQHVAIYERHGGSGAAAASLAETALPAADGSFTITSAPLQVNTVFQARVGRHRARAAVKVTPAITLSVQAPASVASTPAASAHAKRAKSTFTGTVTPAAPGALVALQVSYATTGEHWRSVAWTHAGADGTYTIVHALKTPGTSSVRAIVHAGRHNALAVSEALAFETPQPQNPQLTIASSSDPLLSGETVTISGVAAGAANAPVKLLARTTGGAFTVIAEGATDEAGRYSFAQSPLQNTVYRVTDATAGSTSLFEGVAFALTPTPAAATATAGQPLMLSGTATGAPAGQAVYLEQRSHSGIGFHAIATGTVDATAAYEISHAFAKAGEYVLRLHVPGSTTHLASTSAPFTLSVAA
ncbi:MAG: hypothetical protein JWM60_970 [Solirubrobacterales bacterium]|nr:hypothetical protein [Solirubrobacterales bacterium]